MDIIPNKLAHLLNGVNTDVLYITVALIIATLWSEVLTKELLLGSVFLAYSTNGLWNYINRTMKITDCFSKKVQSYLQFTGLYDEFRKELITISEEFECDVEKAISH